MLPISVWACRNACTAPCTHHTQSFHTNQGDKKALKTQAQAHQLAIHHLPGHLGVPTSISGFFISGFLPRDALPAKALHNSQRVSSFAHSKTHHHIASLSPCHRAHTAFSPALSSLHHQPTNQPSLTFLLPPLPNSISNS